jgi:drug/metabolite transporter (DMT)-like permease
VKLLRNQVGADTKKKAVLFTILAGFLWGTSFPSIKIGLQYMTPFAFVFWRFLIATLTMFSVMRARYNQKLQFQF